MSKIILILLSMVALKGQAISMNVGPIMSYKCKLTLVELRTGDTLPEEVVVSGRSSDEAKEAAIRSFGGYSAPRSNAVFVDAGNSVTYQIRSTACSKFGN